MIERGREWQARSLAEAARELSEEASTPHDAAYAAGVEDIMRLIVGDIAEPTPELRPIYQRYLDSV